MISSQKEFLSHFGWNDFFESQVLTLSSENLHIARVVNEEKHLYRLQMSKDQSIWATVAGKMLFAASTREDYPAVGDWVLVAYPPGSERAVVHFIFKRKTILQRKKVGEVSETQILATNVDTIFITTSVNMDLNYGRLERYLIFAWESGATPVILLTKTDLCEDVQSVVESVRNKFPGVAIHSVRNDAFTEAGFFADYLGSGKTAVLVGSSGVGKSTIGNYLIGKEVITTQEIRADDEKGKHTTTSRAMYESFYGGLIIDTPGMRELQFSDHEQGFDHLFGDVEELISQCHFNDCHHQYEKNCAITTALESGALDPMRWRSFNKLQREVRHEQRKQSKWIMAQDKKAWKKRSIESRHKFKGRQ